MLNIKKIVLLLFGLISLRPFIFQSPAAFAQSKGPLRIHPDNSRYFTDNSGKVIYLTGSHTWSNIFDIDQASQIIPCSFRFDFDDYLNFLADSNHNFIRGWTWELSRYSYDGKTMYSCPQPWARTGLSNALDGFPKFNLYEYDQAYFNRIRQNVIKARDRGIYVSIMLFEGHGPNTSQSPWKWNGHPFNKDNNTSGINGDSNMNDAIVEFHTMAASSTILDIQKNYAKKVVDTVNDLDNVLYEIANEDGGGSAEWQYYFINFIKDYEKTKPKQHPVGMTFRWPGGTNLDLFNSPADWISPKESSSEKYATDPPVAVGSKVIIVDTDHLCGPCGERSWVWKNFTRGNNFIYMDPYDSTANESVRNAMGATLKLASRINLAGMTPQKSLCGTGYCLVESGKEYVIYQPNSGTFSVDLRNISGSFFVEWLNPNTGSITIEGQISGGSNRSFTPPFAGDAIIYLKSTSLPPPTHCQPLGDIDCNSKVNAFDFGSLIKYWDLDTFPAANLDDIGIVDKEDTLIMLGNYINNR